ncbi:hypothetical protein AO067_18035 [Pseudomonas viridiflava ICMP 13104]|uniref:DUF7693 domain-containing protein n=1 Tax=Pseudomonas viridiflava ICMP 13104 TaxID=1198305 RepID=A0A0W0HNM9_PSEVI|nr:hypothetical protein AO067_18035 [Pseudomonas viridiflava ICMP 13104]
METLTTREVYQQLRDAAMGTRPLQRVGQPSQDGLQNVDIDGWLLTLEVTENSPNRCLYCLCPDGRKGSLESWLRTDPVSLLSGWEAAQIQRLLREAVESDIELKGAGRL